MSDLGIHSPQGAAHTQSGGGESAGHTPGPWSTDGDGIVRHHGSGGVLGIKLGSPWIEGAWDRENADAETLANARLIAAAPDGLAFAMAYLAEAEASGGWKGDEGLFAMAQAYVAKATRVAYSAGPGPSGYAEGVNQKSPTEHGQ